MQERIRWVDTARFLGIFTIYLGHMGADAGNSYKFVFQYHVAFFFFLSGCMDIYDKEDNILHFIIKKIRKILIPFWLFSVLSIAINIILYDTSLGNIKDMLFLVIKGAVRNTFIASSLWFLTCLFMMEILFKIFKTCIHKKWILLAICIILYLISETMIVPRPIIQPHWLYNLDSTFYYIIFFAIGYIAYPYILSLFDLNTLFKRGIFIVSNCICFVYSALLFSGRDLLDPLYNIPLIGFGIFIPVLRALLIIWLNLFFAKLLEKIYLFNELGRNTLYLCGNEYFMKNLLVSFLSLVGLELHLPSPFSAYLYTSLLLLLCLRIIIPFEKRLVHSMVSCFNKL